MNKSNFFFCYNKQLFSYLKDIKNIEYITVAQNPSTQKTFALFVKSNRLQQALDEYKQSSKT